MTSAMINDINKSIIKTYRKTIWKKAIKAIDKYQMINENDKIAVCISGGKDSFLLALVLKEINRHHKIKFQLEFIVMNPGYSDKVITQIKENAKKLELDLHFFKTDIFKDIQKEKNPCYVCARKRRGNLYNEALKLGCNKIALG
ncbi:MAG: ATP-binding protein, partial [Bacilli bacterium]|nr:ATP-binding protein [Bacilli bacterium]